MLLMTIFGDCFNIKRQGKRFTMGKRYCETLPERVTREALLAKSGEILTDMSLFLKSFIIGYFARFMS
jgi:hypothetical protein